jgi:hypothetical protein
MIDVPADFIAFLRDEEARASDLTIDDQRAAALDFYNGEPYGDEEDGRSQAVTRDVAEVVDQMTISVLRTMISGDRIVEFECDDEALSLQITEAVNYAFMRGQRSMELLHTTLKAGLLEKTAAVKCCVEPVKKRIVKEVSGIELAMLAEQGIEPVKATEITDEPDGEDGPKFRCVFVQDMPPVFRDYAIPNEEFLVASDARAVDDDTPYKCERTLRTVSDLAALGFDVDGINDSDNVVSEVLSNAREQNMRYSNYQGLDRKGAERKVWHLIETVRYDLDEDGFSELLEVNRVGNTVFSVKEIEFSPYEEWCPFPMPHRRIGQSLADKTMDIQRANSVLLRQAFDNLYLTNAPRTAIDEAGIGATTIDELLTVRPGALIRYKGGMPPTPFEVPFVADKAFSAIEFMIGQREARTGITRHNQGLDADSLNKTASGMAMLKASGEQFQEYIARQFGEFIGRVMLKKYRLMRQHAEPMSIKVDGKRVQVDPKQWPEDVEVMVRTGLGTGNKDERIQKRMTVISLQQAAIEGGLRIVSEQEAYNSGKALIEDMGLGDPSLFFLDPKELPPSEPKPDPEMAKVQAAAMLDAHKQESAQADAAQKHTLAEQEAEAKLMLMEREGALKADLAERQAQHQMSLAERRMDAELMLAERRMVFEAALSEKKQDHAHQIAANRPGGDLDK